MMKVTVIEKIEEGLFAVEYELDGENLGEGTMTYESIRADIVSGNKAVKYEFQEEIDFQLVQVDKEEDEYFVYVSNFNCSEFGVEFDDLAQYFYKTEKGALNKANKLAEQYETYTSILYC